MDYCGCNYWVDFLGIEKMSYGYRGDVNNTISASSVYPGGQTFSSVPYSSNRYRFRNNSPGELGAINQGNAMYSGMRGDAARVETNGDVETPSVANGFLGKPSSWWVMFAIVFVTFVWLAKRYDGSGGSTMGNLAPTLFNGIVLTFFIVLMLNLLKVFATRFRIPGISELILAA